MPSPILLTLDDATPHKPRGLPTRLPRGGGAGKWREIADALDGTIDICSSSSEDGSEAEVEERQLVWDEGDTDIDIWYPAPRQPRAHGAKRWETTDMLDGTIEIFSLSSEDGSKAEEKEGQLVWGEEDADIGIWPPPPRQPRARRAEMRKEATHDPEEMRERQQVFLKNLRRQREVARRIEEVATVQEVVERRELTAMDVQEYRKEWGMAAELECAFAHKRVDSFALPDAWLPATTARPSHSSAVRTSANLARNSPRARRRCHGHREYRLGSVIASSSHQWHYHRTSEWYPSSLRRATTDAEDEVPLVAPMTRKGVKTLRVMTGWFKWRKRVKKASDQ